MHLTYYIVRRCWKLRFTTCALWLCIFCSLWPNWSNRPDNPILSALISSQASLAPAHWSQEALGRKDVSPHFTRKADRHKWAIERYIINIFFPSPHHCMPFRRKKHTFFKKDYTSIWPVHIKCNGCVGHWPKENMCCRFTEKSLMNK